MAAALQELTICRTYHQVCIIEGPSHIYLPVSPQIVIRSLIIKVIVAGRKNIHPLDQEATAGYGSQAEG